MDPNIDVVGVRHFDFEVALLLAAGVSSKESSDSMEWPRARNRPCLELGLGDMGGDKGIELAVDDMRLVTRGENLTGL